MVTDSNSSISIPNPYTPLAFLPAAIADQFQNSCYFYIVGTSIAIYDWLASLPEEYLMLQESRLSIPVIAYFLSRIAANGYCITLTIFQTAPVAHCQAFVYITAGFLIVGESTTALLFFIRVRAIYENSKFITGLFGFAWVVNLGVSFLIPFATHGEDIGPTKRCINTSVEWYSILPIIMNVIFNTLVFLAISFRIISLTIVGDTWQARLRCFTTGNGIPRMSRGLLQGGQLYYLVVLSFSIVFLVVVCSPSIPPVYRAALGPSTVAIVNTMACRVFRGVRLGIINDHHVTSFFANTGGSYGVSHEYLTPSQIRTVENPRNFQVNVEITKTTTDI